MGNIEGKIYQEIEMWGVCVCICPFTKIVFRYLIKERVWSKELPYSCSSLTFI